MPLADVVICHAGYGTIKDCIIYEVPILALPCSYDQHGNAARVEALSIGKRSTLLKRTIMERISKKAKSFDDIEKIETLLLELISNHKYKDNISAWENTKEKSQKQEYLFKLTGDMTEHQEYKFYRMYHYISNKWDQEFENEYKITSGIYRKTEILNKLASVLYNIPRCFILINFSFTHILPPF